MKGKKELRLADFIDVYNEKSELSKKYSVVRIIEDSHETEDGYKTIRWGQCSACGEKDGWARPLPDSFKYCPDCGRKLLWE